LLESLGNMLSLSSASLAFAPTVVPAAPVVTRTVAPIMETVGDLKTLANKLNPSIGYWDPLGMCNLNLYGMGEEATIGWLRHSEIKHGRIAMFAFIGYISGANGLHFPFNLNGEGVSYANIAAAGTPPDQWDALPTSAKLQILGAIGILEFFGESTSALEASGQTHYTKGGKPGFYPSLKTAPGVPHPMPFDLFDPFGFSANASPEKKARGLEAEINNGRLAMIGIFGFVAENKVHGAVPALPFIKPYAGEVMAPFSATNADLPLVADMLKYPWSA